jgi:hypothetical protein
MASGAAIESQNTRRKLFAFVFFLLGGGTKRKILLCCLSDKHNAAPSRCLRKRLSWAPVAHACNPSN